MKTYIVKRIDKTKSFKYNFNSPFHYCNGIKELREYCGGSVHYSKNAKSYFAYVGDIEYIATEC